jgi:hypothetical protein
MADAVIKAEGYALERPQEILNLAALLKKHIKDNSLTSKIQGKDFVNVEGWQFAGAMLGLTAIPDEPVDLSNDTEVKYKCNVRIIKVGTGEQVGAGFAICSNKEASKRRFDEYAIASMAQTRAVGKGYRNLLAWVIKAAGYEAPPAEEMDFHKEPEPEAKPKPTPKSDVMDAVQEHAEPLASDYKGKETDYPITFGKHKGKTLRNFTEEQLNTLVDMSDLMQQHPELYKALTGLLQPLPF